MNNSAASLSRAPEYPNPLARADALEREITDLCAQINAASYRLLQLVAELDDEEPWGAWGLNSCAHWLNLHIAPVGLEPNRNSMMNLNKMWPSEAGLKGQFVTGSSPIPALTCPDAPELGLPSSRSYSYGSQSSPASRRICPASSLGILVQYAGYLALRHWHERGTGKGPRRACAQTVAADLRIVCHG